MSDVYGQSPRPLAEWLLSDGVLATIGSLLGEDEPKVGPRMRRMAEWMRSNDRWAERGCFQGEDEPKVEPRLPPLSSSPAGRWFPAPSVLGGAGRPSGRDWEKTVTREGEIAARLPVRRGLDEGEVAVIGAERAQMSETLLTMRDVTAMIPFSRVHVMRLAGAGKFPRPIKLGERRIAFLKSEIIAWIDGHNRAWQPKAEAGS